MKSKFRAAEASSSLKNKVVRFISDIVDGQVRKSIISIFFKTGSTENIVARLLI